MSIKSYFYLQLKRILKIFPFILLVTLFLFGSVVLIFQNILKSNSESLEQKSFHVGVVGDTDSSYLQFGIEALKTYDTSRFAIELVELDEMQAKAAMEKGELSAYIVIPDGFVQDALHGKIGTLRYVTTSGSIGLTSIFKDELTKVIAEILVNSQRGTYGVERALNKNGYEALSYTRLNELSLEYMDFLLNRSSLYQVETLGIADSLSLTEYFYCGFTVLFLLLMGLPCVILFVKRDFTLNKLIAIKGKKAAKQVACEYLSYVLSVVVLLFLLILLLKEGGKAVTNTEIAKMLLPGSMDSMTVEAIMLELIPVLAMITSLTFMLFELSSDLVSGVLLQLVVSMALAYISGCLYPVYMLPETAQKLSVFLPTGIARSYLASCITDQYEVFSFAGLILYFVLFFAITVLIRRYKLSR